MASSADDTEELEVPGIGAGFSLDQCIVNFGYMHNRAGALWHRKRSRKNTEGHKPCPSGYMPGGFLLLLPATVSPLP